MVNILGYPRISPRGARNDGCAVRSQLWRWNDLRECSVVESLSREWTPFVTYIRRSGEVGKRRTFDIDRVPDVYTKESRNRTEWGNHSTRTGRTKGTSVVQRVRQRARRDKARKIARINELGKARIPVCNYLSFPGHGIWKGKENSGKSNSRFPAYRRSTMQIRMVFLFDDLSKSSSWFNSEDFKELVISLHVSRRDVAIIKNANFPAHA